MLGEAGGQRLELVGSLADELDRRARLHEAVQHAAGAVGQPVQLGAARRRHGVAQLLHPDRPAGRAGVRTASLTPLPSRSTTSGAWSDGPLPLRALRSMSAQRARSATEREPRTRSMRMPIPLWKLPAR